MEQQPCELSLKSLLTERCSGQQEYQLEKGWQVKSLE